MHKEEVIMQILDSIKVYADIETSALRAENERLRGLLKQTFIYYQIEAPEEAWAKFETENNL